MFPWCWYKVQTSLANSTCPSALFNIFLVFALVPPICSATKWDRWTSMTVSSSIIPISLKIHGNKENYPRASRVWPWFEHALLVFLINWLYSCTRSDSFAQNNLSNGLMKNFTKDCCLSFTSTQISNKYHKQLWHIMFCSQIFNSPLSSSWKNVNFFLQIWWKEIDILWNETRSPVMRMTLHQKVLWSELSEQYW